MGCPNKQHPLWKNMVLKLGEELAYKVYKANSEKLLSVKEAEAVVKRREERSISDEQLAPSVNEIPLTAISHPETYHRYNLTNIKNVQRRFKTNSDLIATMLNNLNRLSGLKFTKREVSETESVIDISKIEVAQQVNVEYALVTEPILEEEEEEEEETEKIVDTSKEAFEKLAFTTQLAIKKVREVKADLIARSNRDNTSKSDIRDRLDKLGRDEADLFQNDTFITALGIASEAMDRLEMELSKNVQLSDTEVSLMGRELSTWKTLLDWIQDAKNSDYSALHTKAVQDSTEVLQGRYTRIHADIMKVTVENTKAGYKRKMRKAPSKDFSTVSVEINKAKRFAADLSRSADKLAQYIDTLLKSKDRNTGNVIAKIFSVINAKMTEMTDAEIDITSKEFQRKYTNSAGDGLVDEYSEHYREQVKAHEHTRIRINNLKYGKQRTKQTKKFKEWEKNNLITVNASKVTGYKAEVTAEERATLEKEELDRLTSMYGAEKASQMIKKSKELYKEYLKDKKIKIARIEEDAEVHTEEGKLLEGDAKKQYIYNRTNYFIRANNPLYLNEYLSDKKSNSFVHTGVYSVQEPMHYESNDIHYDKRFKELQSDEAAMEFLDWYKATLDALISKLPQNIVDKLDSAFLPDVTKKLSEKLVEKGFNAKGISDRIIDLLKSGEFTELALESITADGDQSSFFDSANRKQRRVLVANHRNKAKEIGIEITKLEDAIELNTAKAAAKTRELDKYIKYGFENDPDALVARAELNVINKKIAEDTAKIEPLKVKKDKVKENKSTDLFGILKAFAVMAISYEQSAEVEDSVLLAKRVMDNITQYKDHKGDLIEDADGAKNIKALAEYTINSSLYGETRVDRKTTNIDVVLSKDDRVVAKAVKKIKIQAYEDEANGIITSKERHKIVVEQDARYEALNKAKLSWSKVLDWVLAYTQLKGLGYNPISSSVNLVYGLIMNQMYAASQTDTTHKDMMWAFKIMWGAAFGQATGKKIGEAKKIDNLINKTNILFEVNEAAYGTKNSISDKLKKLGFLIPFEMQKRGEYIIQGMMMVALMRTKKVTIGISEVSLYDCYTEEGVWDTEKYGAEPSEWSDDISAKDSNEYTRFRDMMIQTIKRVHGNYDPTSFLEGKSTSIGRMAFQYKSWVPEGVLTRFEDAHDEEQMGRVVKGRYVTYKDIKLKNAFSIMLNPMYLLGLKKVELNGFGNIKSEVDLQNMRYNIAEARWIMVAITVNLLAALAYAVGDDDDDEVRGIKSMINTMGRLQSDLTFYMNPLTIVDIAKNPFPVLQTFSDVHKAIVTIRKTAFSDSDYYSTSHLLKSIAKPLPLVGNIASVLNSDSRIYANEPVKIFKGMLEEE